MNNKAILIGGHGHGKVLNLNEFSGDVSGMSTIKWKYCIHDYDLYVKSETYNGVWIEENTTLDQAVQRLLQDAIKLQQLTDIINNK